MIKILLYLFLKILNHILNHKGGDNVVRYRIYTEDINRDTNIIPILNSYFEGYTIIPAFGMWQGVSEASIVIEYITDHEYLDLKVKQVCDTIKHKNKQQSILYTREDIKSVLISDDTWFN